MGKSMTIAISLLACLLLTAGEDSLAAFPKNTDGRKAVLITGASTGIGRVTAERLARSGHLVYAGARKQADIAALNAIPNIRALRLDVTRQDEIDAAYELVRAQGLGLWGLVNNAGINRIDPLIEVDMEDLQLLFDVNVFGVARVTKTFAPLIIDSKGRVVVVSSISGVLAGFPAYGGYAMTKHAIEAYIDQLSEEMKMFEVRVAGIEPGNFDSQIGMTRCRNIVDEAKQYRWYTDLMKEHFEYCKQRVSSQEGSGAPDPTPVARAIADALFDAEPAEHYLVTADPFESEIVMRKSFERIHHFNQGQARPYTRAQLLEYYDDEKLYATGEKTRRIGE
jgi:NAD(P)-dependent dehydrogenase (short-subunit alcohol dehydrogenase family)